MVDTQTNTTAAPLAAVSKKPRQGRSPAFPFISLSKALARAETFRVAEGGRPKHFSPLAAACKAWGVGVKTGPGIQTVAALGHYGLFEFEGAAERRSARLTDLAFRILLDKQPTSPERDELIRRAALTPQIHAELWKNWPDGLPSNATLETYLVRDRAFSESGARDLIAQYKETIAFAKLGQAGNMSALASDAGDDIDDESEQIECATPRSASSPALLGRMPGVALMEGERVVFTEESDPQQYVKLIASGEIDESLLDALSDYVKRQRKRLGLAADNQTPKEKEDRN